ncbi:MAG: hypothetical protein KAW45_07425, partial [Thermoplasmatales archaeon]|nr:hypothetical protein [Thermoplasmatales archaeon]
MTNHAIEKTKDHVIKLANKGDISNKNKQLILNFVDKLMAEGHKNGAYSPNRIRKYLYGLITMSKIIKKDFDKATKEDINQLAAKIRDDYTGETPRDYLVMLRIFMKYIKELDGERFNENEFPDIVKNIKPRNRRFPNIKKSSLLTLEDVKELASYTQNLRDRCFIVATGN